ncbi:peptidoglycan recognition protein family protein [Streptomyces sp. 4N509B]|uniref:peptidoglycan recognition protein family protein n=1 Tax=Streptomyces sp. 4N509B TaxID=3457413 RepID=UPI003FD570A7
MATPLKPDPLLKVLRDEGLRVVEVRSWRTHNRDHVGPWGPVNGVMLHHTAPHEDPVTLCYVGRADLPGPLCHGVITKDGVVHMVGNGRANHAGGGDPDVLAAVRAESYGERPPPPTEHAGSPGAVDGNAPFYGFECHNDGDGEDPWPPAQQDAMVRAAAALCRAHGWSAKSTIGHLEWSDQKIDPLGLSMVTLRARIAERLAHAASWNPESPAQAPTPPSAPRPDGVTLSEEDVRRIADAVVARKIRVEDGELALGSVVLRAYTNAREAKEAALRVEAGVRRPPRG